MKMGMVAADSWRGLIHVEIAYAIESPLTLSQLNSSPYNTVCRFRGPATTISRSSRDTVVHPLGGLSGKSIAIM